LAPWSNEAAQGSAAAERGALDSEIDRVLAADAGAD
jgi:hypothetical protein